MRVFIWKKLQNWPPSDSVVHTDWLIDYCEFFYIKCKKFIFLGATRTEDVKELIHARQSVVVHAKAYGLQAIDMVYINFKGNLKNMCSK